MQARTYQERNALASQKGGVIPVPSAVVFTPTRPAFVSLEAATMGAYGTAKDGYDAMFAPLVTAAPSHDAQVKAMDGLLAASAFKAGAIATALYLPIGAKIAALAGVGDAQLKDFNGAAQITTPPPTPPPKGGGDGHQSGSDGRGPGGGSCAPTTGTVAFQGVQRRVVPTEGRVYAKDVARQKNLIGPCRENNP